MSLATAIAEALAAIFGYFATRGIDAIIGKYLASIQIAFEKTASEKAKVEYKKSLDEIAAQVASKKSVWEKWRGKSLPPS